ncbi:MAG: hypothetical protein ACO4AU_09975 [bacterium]
MIRTLFTSSWIVLLLIAGCSPPLAEFEVQRPARLTVPREVRKVFIREDLIRSSQDQLGLKAQVLQALAQRLNQLGRFEAQVVSTLNEGAFNPEQESVAIIQGEILSSGEVDSGQFTDIATCTRGIAGRVSSIVGAAAAEEVITADQLIGVCRRGSLKGDVVEGALGAALALAGAGGLPPKNQVVRAYEYRNLSLFAQVNLSFTTAGKTRETLAIRADASSYGRQVIDPKTFRHVEETHLIALTLGGLLASMNAPVFPNPAPLAEGSKPRAVFYNQPRLPLPEPGDFPGSQREQLVTELIQQALRSFVRTVSPYKVTVQAEVASGGDSEAANALGQGRALAARNRLNKISANQRAAADWYNLGLAYEASAAVIEDYEDARRFYQEALRRDSGNLLFAQGIGRVERVLDEARRLDQQLSASR